MLSLLLTLASAGGTLKLTWADCGGTDTHAKVQTLTPASLTLGEKTAVLGSGKLDEDVTGGSWTITVKASIISKTCTGDLGTQSTCELPLGLGSLVWEGLALPLKEGPAVKVGMQVMLAGSLPAKLATASIKLEATETNGHKLLCLQLNTAPEAELELETVTCKDFTAACSKQCQFKVQHSECWGEPGAHCARCICGEPGGPSQDETKAMPLSCESTTCGFPATAGGADCPKAELELVEKVKECSWKTPAHQGDCQRECAAEEMCIADHSSSTGYGCHAESRHVQPDGKCVAGPDCFCSNCVAGYFCQEGVCSVLETPTLV